MAVTAAELQVRFSSQGAAQVKSDIAGVGDAVEATSARSQAATAGAGLAMGALGTGLLDFTKSMTEAGASYQQEMAFINSLAGGTQQTAQMLQDEALKLDRTTVFSAQDIAAGMEQLAREGFTPLQIAGTNAMNSLIQNASNMAAALKISMPDAANILGMTMRAFNIDVSQTAATTDILTEAALRSGKGAAEFNTQLQYVEATAAQLGIPLQDISAAVGELMAQNVPGAGQGLRSFLVGITAEGSTASKEMAKLGISAYDAKGNFIGLGPLIDEINTALANLSPEEQSAAIKALSGGNRQVTALIQLLRDGSSGLTDFEAKMGTLGGAAHVMSTLMDNAAGSFKAFASSLETAKILMGESIAPLFRPVTDGLRELLGAFIAGPTALHAFAAAGIAVTGALFALTGAVALFKALDMGAIFGEMFGGLVAAAPLLLAVVAGGALFYEAWQHNFLGIQSLITGLITDAEKFGAAFHKAFSVDLLRTDPISATLAAISSGFAALNMQGISLWFDHLSVATHGLYLQFSALAQQVMPSLNAAWREFGLANDHLVTAVQDLLAGDVPGALRQWRAALTEIRFAWDDVSTAIGKVADAVGGFIAQGAAWVLNVGIPTVEGDIASIASAVWDWVQNTAWPAVQNAARTLGSLAVKIGGWLVSSAEDLWSKVSSWIQAQLPTVTAFARDIGTVALKITGWLVSAGEDLWGKVSSWIQAQLPAVTAFAKDVGSVAIKIGGWLVSAGQDLASTVIAWIAAHSVQLTGYVKDLGRIAVKIGGWTVSAAEDLWSVVKAHVSTQWVSSGGAFGIPLPNIKITIGGFTIDIPVGTLWKDFNDWFAKETTVTPVDLAKWEARGKTIGKELGDWFFKGVLALFSGGGGTGAGGNGNLSGNAAFSALIVSFGKGLLEGIGAAIVQFLNEIDTAINQVIQKLNALIAAWDALDRQVTGGKFQMDLLPYFGIDGIARAFDGAAKSATDFAIAKAKALEPTVTPSGVIQPGTQPAVPGSYGVPPAPTQTPKPQVIGAFPGGISPAPPLNTAPVPTPIGPAAPSPAAWTPTIQQIANANEQAAQYKNTLGSVSAATSDVWKIGSQVWVPTAQQVANAKDQAGQYGNALNRSTPAVDGLSAANRRLVQSMSDSNQQTSIALIEMQHVVPTALGANAGVSLFATTLEVAGRVAGATVAQVALGAANFTRLGSVAMTAAAGIGSFAASAVTSAASTVILQAQLHATAAAAAALAAVKAVVTITGDNKAALGAIDAATAALGAANGLSATDFVLGDNSNALGSIGQAVGTLAAANGLTATDFMLGDNSNALSSIGEALGSLAAADGTTATTYIDCVDSVPAEVGAAAAALASIAGTTVTTYVNTVSTGVGPTAAQGGIVGNLPISRYPLAGIRGFADGGLTGGSVVLVGEQGPELAYFPNGTYIQPHGASMNALRNGVGGGITLNFGPNSIVVNQQPGQSTEDVGIEIMQAIARAASTHRRGLGVSA